MRFFVPITTSRDHLTKLMRHLEDGSQPERFPFAQTIVSVLYCRPRTLDLLKQYRNDSCVMFDSGCFYVQQGREPLASLALRLGDLYEKHDWADHYVLPDNPPAPNDSLETAQEKVFLTLAVSTKFHAALSEELQNKSVGVVHAVTLEQVDWLVQEYTAARIPYLAFGSFGMTGPARGINKVSYASLEILIHLSGKVHETKSQLHLFGVGSPAQLAIFHALGVSSFDSAGWLRTAAFGSIYMPFLGAFNISSRIKSRPRNQLTESAFRRVCSETGHACQFCRDFTSLDANWMYRALHNLLVMQETVVHINNGKHLVEQDRIERLLNEHSPQFLKYWRFARHRCTWLP